MVFMLSRVQATVSLGCAPFVQAILRSPLSAHPEPYIPEYPRNKQDQNMEYYGCARDEIPLPRPSLHAAWDAIHYRRSERLSETPYVGRSRRATYFLSSHLSEYEDVHVKGFRV